MFRSLIIIAIIGLIFIIIKKRFLSADKTQARNTPSKETVRCEQCDIFIETDDAIADANRFFCCQEHQQVWHNRSD